MYSSASDSVLMCAYVYMCVYGTITGQHLSQTDTLILFATLLIALVLFRDCTSISFFTVNICFLLLFEPILIAGFIVV